MKHITLATLAITLALTTSTHAASISGQGTWESTLQGRDLDGNLSTLEAYYDTTLDITWLADANAAGLMDWSTATNWAASLNFNGISDWRLPIITDTGITGCDYTYNGTDCGYNVDTANSELAHMFYVTLGDKAYFDTLATEQVSDFGVTNSGPFTNIQSLYYWSSTEYALDTSRAWEFHTQSGLQHDSLKTLNMYAWAVHSGDVGVQVSAVPLPTAAWLFCSGLIGLVGIARRKTRV